MVTGESCLVYSSLPMKMPACVGSRGIVFGFKIERCPGCEEGMNRCTDSAAILASTAYLSLAISLRLSGSSYFIINRSINLFLQKYVILVQ